MDKGFQRVEPPSTFFLPFFYHHHVVDKFQETQRPKELHVQHIKELIRATRTALNTEYRFLGKRRGGSGLKGQLTNKSCGTPTFFGLGV
jgi:hypothetical protein